MSKASNEKKPTRWRRRFFLMGLSCLAMVFVGMTSAWMVASALVAPAQREIGDPPGEFAATAFTIPSESGSELAGWHSVGRPGRGVVVLLHGNRGSRLSMLARARQLQERGYSTVLIDMQAHGESHGENITVGFLEQHDARAAVQFAKQMHPGEKIGVIGVSLGGAAALLASPLEIDAMVLESVYPNIDDAVRNRVASKIGRLSWIPSQLLLLQLGPRLGISSDDLRPIDHVAATGCPTCFACGTQDLHTTVAETRLMYRAAKSPKELVLVPGASHVDLQQFAPRLYASSIFGFLEEQLQEPSRSDSTATDGSALQEQREAR